jgi:hypothetical protein
MVLKVINPETNRYITVNGSKYCSLEKKGVFISLDNCKTVQQSLTKKPFKKTDKSQQSWDNKVPKTTAERELLLEKCGESCFLEPVEKKYPICNKIINDNSKCEYNCKGIKAASSRAGEWKNESVLEKSKQLSKKLECYKTSNQKNQMNQFFQKCSDARKKNKSSFQYKGKKYVRGKHNNLIVYRHEQ